MSGRQRLLFVDDEAAVQRAFVRSLAGVDVTVDCRGGVAEALVAMQGTTYDVVATDMTMGDGTGIDVLHACAASLPKAVRIVVSGDPNLGRVLAGIDVDDVIPTAHYEAVAKIIGFIMNKARPIPGRPIRAGAL